MWSPQFTKRFYIRFAVVLFGLIVASPGLYAWAHGNYWFTVFDPRFSKFGTGPTLMFVFFGLLIALFGLFSGGWEAISPKEQKELDRRWQKDHRRGKR
jgi:hypothetical protein